jgi:hypothetical protein
VSVLRRAVGGALRAIRRPRPTPSRVIMVPIDRCLNLQSLAYPAGEAGHDPMTATLLAYRDGTCQQYAGSPLEAFFEVWRPKRLGDVIGVADPMSDLLQRVAAGDTPPYPWARGEVQARGSNRSRRPEMQSALAEVATNAEVTAGIIFYGPVSRSFGEATFIRLVRNYDSIAMEGYRPEVEDRSHIQGRIMISGSDYRVLVGSGKHRLAALSALGTQLIPVRVGTTARATIDLADAASWPNVRTGTYTLEQATQVFERMFAGRQPPGLAGQTWRCESRRVL